MLKLPVASLARLRWQSRRALSRLSASRSVCTARGAPDFARAGLARPLAALAAALLVTPGAQAEEPRQPTEPIILNDTAVDLLQVPDAFDVGDPFDVELHLKFDHEQRSADVKRETSSSDPGLTNGGYLSDGLLVGSYSESTQRLIPELSVGVMRELSLHVGLPIILANSRNLRENEPSGSGALEGLPGETLFSLPFDAPTRSGIEYLAVGADLGLMNQFRNPTLPNWVIGIEGRFNISEPMHACNANAPTGQEPCANPADIDRDGVNDPLGPDFDAPIDDGRNLANEPEGDFEGGRGPGVSRGTHALEAHAYVSRRVKYVEPYTGINALVEFQTPGSDYGPTDLLGVLVNHPPVRGSVVAGIAVVPWEQPENFTRISIDMRVEGTYVSEGRDYSELFDALGSSTAESIRYPNFSEYRGNEIASGVLDPVTPSVVDPNSRRVNFTGITDVQQHGDYKLQTRFTWQAGQYVKFDLGGAWRIIQSHLITFDQSCSPSPLVDIRDAGPCKVNTSASAGGTPTWSATGLPNADYRAVINAPGRRYRVDTSHGFNFWLRASVLF